jgi:hypothetical protein
MTPDLDRAGWRKSSRSNGNNGDCVEVALGVTAAGVRDSKNPGPRLVFTRAAFRAFAEAVTDRQRD